MAQAVRYRNYEARRPIADNDVAVSALPGALQRISWGAVIAGVVISIVVHIALSMLGLAIGAATVDPASESEPLAGLGTGAVMWMAGSALLAMFAGGWTAGRLAGIPHHLDGAMHGLVTWGVTMILTLMLITSGVSSAINTAATAIGQGLNLAAQGASEAAPAVADAIERQDISLQGVREELMSMMQPQGTVISQTPDTAAPDAASPATTGDTAGTTPGTTGATGTTPGMTGTTSAVTPETMTAAQREADFVITRFLMSGADATPEARAEVVSMLTSNGVSEEQAQQTVDRWQAEYQQFAAQVEETTREAGQALAEATTRIAGAAFLLMLLGAFAAAGGGHVGAPEDLSDVVEMETMDTTTAVS